MSLQLHQLTAALYLITGLVAWLGMALQAPRLERASVGLLLFGALFHLAAFATIHGIEPTPPLTDLPSAVSFMAWVGVIFFLGLMRRLRLAGLTVLVAPMAFISVFYAAVRLPHAAAAVSGEGGATPHAHVMLGGAGLALLGVSGLAGLLFLIEHRRIKAKRPIDPRFPLPSLEALDRVNRVSLGAGFPLLTLGVVSGAIWVEAMRGTYWSGTQHETWCAIAWVVYSVLVVARFWARQGSRYAAASALGGFAFLCFAVIGVELLT
jgi:ABC-type transport system involved in cytochrome c biogenesis permease subunit